MTMKAYLPLTPAGRFWVGYLLVLALMIALLSGCSGLSLESRTTAAYGSFVASETFAAALMGSSEVSTDTKARIQVADAKAKPVADALLSTIVECRRVHCDPSTLRGALDAALPAINTLALETTK
jgi:hypothetical protein